jgi:hypothetical protein
VTAVDAVGVDAAARGPAPPLFPDSVLVEHEGTQIELMFDGAGRYPALLEAIRDQVLDVAARSRGWEEPEEIESFRRVFKIGSLFHLDALVLLWSAGRVVGLAGVVRESGLSNAVILHVCSLGLLRQMQNRGFLPTLFALLWDGQHAWPGTMDAYWRGQVYVTAVTQSPLIMTLLGAISDLYPAPDRAAPDADMVRVGRHIIERYEPDVTFDPKSFVLRNECLFGYRKMPYSADRRLNAYCDARLRYEEGDTFMLVGRVKQEAVLSLIDGVARAHAELFQRARSGLVASHPGLAWAARA